jgi:hypothetical protein
MKNSVWNSPIPPGKQSCSPLWKPLCASSGGVLERVHDVIVEGSVVELVPIARSEGSFRRQRKTKL